MIMLISGLSVLFALFAAALWAWSSVVTGFSLGEIDMILDEASEKSPQESGPDDDVPARVPQNIVSRTVDLWILGTHRLLCGDARDPSDYQRLLEEQKADVVLTDPP